jgi:hypothetical protein
LQHGAQRQGLSTSTLHNTSPEGQSCFPYRSSDEFRENDKKQCQVVDPRTFLITTAFFLNTATNNQVFMSGGESTDKLQGDQKVSYHLMITIQKVTRNVQTVPRQSPDIY